MFSLGPELVKLLTGARRERFEYERAISLYQFQVWMLNRTQQFTDLAGQIAATKILDYVAYQQFAEEEERRQRFAHSWSTSFINLNDRPAQTRDLMIALRKDASLGAIYDTYIADLGGLPALLNALPPSKLDAELRKRMDTCSIVSNLIHYRLRHALTLGADVELSTHKHAKFFLWWPTRDVAGKQGVKVEGKAPSTKTMDKWWKEWKDTAVFIFLNECCGFDLFPDAADDNLFVDKLVKRANDVGGLTRFFGAYAFTCEAIFPGQSEFIKKAIPEAISRVSIDVDPFTPDELETIAAYEGNKDQLGDTYSDDDFFESH